MREHASEHDAVAFFGIGFCCTFCSSTRRLAVVAKDALHLAVYSTTRYGQPRTMSGFRWHSNIVAQGASAAPPPRAGGNSSALGRLERAAASAPPRSYTADPMNPLCLPYEKLMGQLAVSQRDEKGCLLYTSPSPRDRG